jgi:hypothetical protein
MKKRSLEQIIQKLDLLTAKLNDKNVLRINDIKCIIGSILAPMMPGWEVVAPKCFWIARQKQLDLHKAIHAINPLANQIRLDKKIAKWKYYSKDAVTC